MRLLNSISAALLALAAGRLGVSAKYVDPYLNHVVTVTVTDNAACAPTSTKLASFKSSSKHDLDATYPVVNVGGSPQSISIPTSSPTPDCWTSTYTIMGSIVVTETYSGPAPTALESDDGVTYVTAVSTKDGLTLYSTMGPSVATVNTVITRTKSSTEVSGVSPDLNEIPESSTGDQSNAKNSAPASSSALPTSTITLSKSLTETITLNGKIYTTVVASTPSSSEEGVTYVTQVSTAPGGYVTAYRPQETSATKLVRTIRRTYTSDSKIYTTTYLTTLNNSTSFTQYENRTSPAAAATVTAHNTTKPYEPVHNRTSHRVVLTNITDRIGGDVPVTSKKNKTVVDSRISRKNLTVPITSKKNKTVIDSGVASSRKDLTTQVTATINRTVFNSSLYRQNRTSTVVSTSALHKNSSSSSLITARPTITTLPPGYGPTLFNSSTSDELTTTTTIWINTTITVYDTSEGTTKPVSTITTAVPMTSISGNSSSHIASSNNVKKASPSTQISKSKSVFTSPTYSSSLSSQSKSEAQSAKSKVTSSISLRVSNSLSSSSSFAQVTSRKSAKYINGTSNT